VELSEIFWGVDWIYVAQGRDRSRDAVNVVMKLTFSQGSIVSSRRALLQVVRWLVGGLLKSRAGYRLHWLRSTVVFLSPSIETSIMVSPVSYFYQRS
jgi:hypothetical protein